ncbi:MAG: EAL domain-containing protein [Cyanobacteria bacterium]|nr:EAL domain-containing protein [Cyanobacteriota bacterium]
MTNKKMRVLLIEENAGQAKFLRKVLDSAANDFTMEWTDQLTIGLERLEKDKFDIVLLGFSHTEKNGIEVLNELRQLDSRVPVVVLSEQPDDHEVAEAVKSGAQDYLIRESIDEARLVQSMRYAIDLKRAEEALREASNRLDAATSRLEALANHDPLTECLNMAGLEMSLKKEFERAQRGGWNLVAVLLDCDDFDRINAQLGHGVGDVVLKEISKRMKETVRPTDHIARIGSDEFLLLLPDTRFAEGMLVAEKIRLSVAESPLRLASETIRVTASLGVLALPYEFCSIEEVLSLVRLAVRESKMLGKNRVSSGEKHKRQGQPDRDALEELTEKLRKGDCFRAVSMPILHLPDEGLVGYEILSRGPDGAFEMPVDLFRVSVEYNLLTIVDLRCLKTCLAASVEERYEKNATIHVNLFPSTIIDTPIDRLMTLFPDDAANGRFCIEISEQQFIGDPTYLRDHVQELRKRGVQVAIDDVGFGRSSLESLIILEPDIVKIDRKYVSGIAQEPTKERLLRRLVKVVNALGSNLVAEGIECREELDLLLDMGVLYGQGWYWGKPS